MIAACVCAWVVACSPLAHADSTGIDADILFVQRERQACNEAFDRMILHDDLVFQLMLARGASDTELQAEIDRAYNAENRLLNSTQCR
jgi:hypothetical protein